VAYPVLLEKGHEHSAPGRLVDPSLPNRIARNPLANFKCEKGAVDFTLILPTYNESENLPLLFERIDRTINDANFRPRGYKILIYLYARAVHRFGKGAIRLRERGYQFANREPGRSKLTVKVMLDYFLMLMELRFQTPVPNGATALVACHLLNAAHAIDRQLAA
jgi:hypothetical protein